MPKCWVLPEIKVFLFMHLGKISFYRMVWLHVSFVYMLRPTKCFNGYGYDESTRSVSYIYIYILYIYIIYIYIYIYIYNE